MIFDLQEDKAKKLAQVVTNDSCRKILDYLADKEATETDLAEKLGLPMSTVHYNLSQLVGTGLIIADEFHYSKKGKEVNHYKLANKYIIIAQKSLAAPALQMAQPVMESAAYTWMAQYPSYLWFAGGVVLSAASFLILEYIRFKISNK